MKIKANKKELRCGIISDIDIKKPANKALYVCLLIIAVAATLVCVLPPLWVIMSSVKDIKEFYAIPPTFIPKTFDLSKVKKTWETYAFGKYYFNTIAVAIGCIVVGIVSNGLAGYALSKFKVKGMKIMFAVIMLSLMMPTGGVTMVPVYKNILDFPLLHLNLTNTYWPMWLMAGAKAFNIIVFKSFFDGIPDSFLESARLDGCTDLGAFARIVVPLSKPVVFTMVILLLNGAWSDFFWPFMVLRNKDMYTVTVEMYMISEYVQQDKLVILLAFSIVPPIIFFMIFQKNIMQGFTASGIKG